MDIILLLPLCIFLRRYALTSPEFSCQSLCCSISFSRSLPQDYFFAPGIPFVTTYLLPSHFVVTTLSLDTMTMERPSDRLFKYPPMERQDLNQSQLGSFKFTPVDNVGSLQAIATSYMNSQINAYLARVKASSSSSSDRPSHPAGGIVKADFFNKHIKPDLGDSRLRLGPAAVRSAVEGAATSPTRQGHMLSDQMNPDRLSTDQIDTSSAASFHPSGRSQLVSLLCSIFMFLQADLVI